MVILAWALCVGCMQQTKANVVERVCGPVLTFADGKQPSRILHVDTGGSDETGDGSMLKPFRSIAAAARAAKPGTAVYIHAGTYRGGLAFAALRGSASAPIWLMGAPGETRPIIRGGGEGLHLVRPRYVVVSDLEIRDIEDNGINVDDGDAVADAEAARFLVFRNIDVHDVGQTPHGVADCLKMAGVNDVVIARSRFGRCGSGPSTGAVGVGGVGVQRAVVRFNTFEANGYGGVQFKGGSSNVEISSNVFVDAGDRDVQMGGSTGVPSFRPPLRSSDMNYEAAHIQVVANLFVGGEAAVAFTGCIGLPVRQQYRGRSKEVGDPDSSRNGDQPDIQLRAIVTRPRRWEHFFLPTIRSQHRC